MAGNTKTKKSMTIKGVDKPSTKGTKVGVNPKATVVSTAQTKMKKGGMVGKKK